MGPKQMKRKAPKMLENDKRKTVARHGKTPMSTSMPSEEEASNIGEDGEEIEQRNKPMQPMIDAQDLAPYINRVYPRPSSQWCPAFIEELGSLMANRGGFNCSNRAAIAAAGLGVKLDWFLAQYVDLYETNQHFEDLIDPWYVICEGIPDIDGFIEVVNAANAHIGGGPLANDSDEPIQFSFDRHWFLQCPDRERAQRVAAFLHGRMNEAAFHTSVIDSRFLSFI